MNICLWTKSKEKVGHAAKQPSAFKTIYQRVVKEEEEGGCCFEMANSKSSQ